MSMNDYPIMGYGFDVNDVRWNYKALIAKLYEYDIAEGDYSIMEEFASRSKDMNCGLKDLFKEFDPDDEAFRLIIDGCTWLDYENAPESASYVMIYSRLPWESAKSEPKSEKECKSKMWEIIRPYVENTFTYGDFESVVGRIEDTYYG